MSVTDRLNQRTIGKTQLDSTASPAAQRGANPSTGKHIHLRVKTVICRITPSSDQCFTSAAVAPLQYRLFPECNAAAHKVVRKRCAVKNQPFPENMDEVPVVKADLSVPDLCEIVTQEVKPRQKVSPQVKQNDGDDVHISCGVPLGISFRNRCLFSHPS